MVNYPVFPVLASISIPATAFPSPGHVPEITYRLFAQLPRLAARSTSFSFPLPPPSYLFPRPLSSFSFFLSFLLFCWPVHREKSAPDLSFCAASENGVRLRGLRERSWISTRHVPVFPFSFPLSFFLSLFLDSTLWIKTPRLLTFSPPSVITGEQGSNWKRTCERIMFHLPRFVKTYKIIHLSISRLSRY